MNIEEIKTEEQRDKLVKQLQAMKFVKPLPSSWEEYKEWNALDMQNRESLKLLENWNQPTKITKKIIATIKLDLLMKVYNDGWVADFFDNTQKKSIIVCYNKVVQIYTSDCIAYEFITLKNEETAELFLKNFERLIKDYLMIV